MFRVSAGLSVIGQKAAVSRVIAAAALVLAGLAVSSVVSAGSDGPAVSAPNGKLSIEGGAWNSSGGGLALGSYTLPLGSSLGVQFDGALGSIQNNTLSGGGVHIFARDPSRYLFGFYGSYHTWEGMDVWRTAGEFQLFGDRVSLDGLAGIEGITFPTTWNGQPVLNQSNTHFFGQASLDYYPIDDLQLSVGVKYADQTVLGTADAEYLLHGLTMPVSLFVDGQFGQSGYGQITGGARAYLGGASTKSLIARQRQDDPPNYTPTFPQAVVMATSTNVCAGKNADDHNACTIDSCDIATGNIVNTPIVCNDNNPDTVDSCDPTIGCIFTPK